MSRRVVDNVVLLKEGHGFLRGLVGLVGFRQTSVLYDRDPRAAGSSKYNRFLGSLVIGLNGRIYDESRNRPKYIVESRYGWDTSP
jgi:hypothetical protein